MRHIVELTQVCLESLGVLDCGSQVLGRFGVFFLSLGYIGRVHAGEVFVVKRTLGFRVARHVVERSQGVCASVGVWELFEGSCLSTRDVLSVRKVPGVVFPFVESEIAH